MSARARDEAERGGWAHGWTLLKSRGPGTDLPCVRCGQWTTPDGPAVEFRSGDGRLRQRATGEIMLHTYIFRHVDACDLGWDVAAFPRIPRARRGGGRT